MSETISMGDRRLPVVPQRHARLTHGFEALMKGLTDIDGDLSSPAAVIGVLGEKAYDALALLIPAVGDIPRHEFMGYATEQAMADGHYDPEQDRSPDFAQIVGAFETAMRVSRFDVLRPLLKLVDPTLLSATVNAALAEQVEKSSLSTTSPSSPSTSGA